MGTVGTDDARSAAGESPAFDPRDLAGLFAAPRWLRDLGTSAWLAVGLTLFVVAVVTILALTQTIVTPVITAAVVAAVASPLVRMLHVARGLAVAIVLVGAIVLSIAVVGIVVGGVSAQVDALRPQIADAKDTLAGWATDLGVSHDAAKTAEGDASSAIGDAVPALLKGVGAGLKSLSSLAVFLSLTLLSLFLLLKDGPGIRSWAEGHMRVPRPVAHGITQRLLQSLRGYFVGVAFVALFNAAVVGVGALLLGVPLAGTIAVVTFVGAFIPYLGAWSAGAFSVLVALGGSGTDAAVVMIVIQLLANGVLQQMVQPLVFGAALGIHPLAVLIVTIAGGALFGAVGLILAAPLTAAATHIAADLSVARGAGGCRGGAPVTQPAIESAPLAKEWYLLTIAGAASFVIGVVVLAYPDPSLKLFGLFIGIDLLIAAVALIVRGVSIVSPDGTGQGTLLLGVLALIAGLVVIKNPGATLKVIAIVFAIWLVVAGAVSLGRAVSFRGHRMITALKGLVQIAVGVTILSWPEIGLATLTLLVGIGLCLQGAIEVGESFILRSSQHAGADR